MEHILSMTAVTSCCDDGQKIVRAVLEYDEAIASESVHNDSFSVKDRRITAVKTVGSTVTIELDPNDAVASIIPQMVPHKKAEKPVGKPGNDGFKGPPPNIPGKKRRAVEVRVRQIKDVFTVAGKLIPASDEERVSDRASEPVIEDFVQDELNGLAYNLFIPKNIVPGEKYPLVMFIEDAGACGNDPKIALSQGNGAVGFASNEWQSEHPCYVLAPQISGEPMTRDDFTVSDDLEKIKDILDYVIKSNAVDKHRIYATGQSMGCMASCELNIRYPE